MMSLLIVVIPHQHEGASSILLEHRNTCTCVCMNMYLYMNRYVFVYMSRHVYMNMYVLLERVQEPEALSEKEVGAGDGVRW